MWVVLIHLFLLSSVMAQNEYSSNTLSSTPEVESSAPTSSSTYEGTLKAHFTHARAIQNIRVRAKETLIRKGLPLQSQEEFESRVKIKALELMKETPSYSEKDATQIARSLVGSTYGGERFLSYQTSGVRSGARYRVHRTPIESWELAPFATGKRHDGQGNFVLVQGAKLALEYRETVSPMPGVQDSGYLSQKAVKWGNLFEFFTFPEMYNTENSSFDTFKADLDRRGFSLLREDSTSVVIGTPSSQITLDKSHGMMILEVVQYSVSPGRIPYVEMHTVNSDFSKVADHWIPRRSVEERFGWDEDSKTGVLRDQLTTEFEEIEVNCRVSEEELDFLIPVNTMLTGKSSNARMAMLNLPYCVSAPTPFSRFESNLGLKIGFSISLIILFAVVLFVTTFWLKRKRGH
jgi:hypothetical protein